MSKSNAASALVRIPLASITVMRKIDNVNRSVIPPIGEPFEFTQQEIDEVMKLSPQALKEAGKGQKADPEVPVTVVATGLPAVTDAGKGDEI